MIDIGFDVISDLNLEPNDSFNWHDKPTSLYCILTGNISTDMKTVTQTLVHLSQQYQGVFYTPGTLEYETSRTNINERTSQLVTLAQKVPNIVILHHNIVIVDGVAVVGSNCWETAHEPGTSISIDDLKYNQYRLDDMGFLHKTIEKLQRHLDVKKIVLVTNGVPNENCYFGEVPDYVATQTPLDTVLNADSESKVTHWVYGSYNKPVQATLILPRKNDIQAVSNPLEGKNVKQFNPTRITISV
jgi:hypothetical protein|tara:strand:- start:39 stop:770 length:732 start_codon:yes stop_codon:yes gene_type:complete